MDFVEKKEKKKKAAFRGLWNLWKRGQQVTEKLRLRFYQAFIIPVLLYNSGTWAVTKTAQERLDSFHRRQLRSLIGIRWLQTISNNALYARCESQPISHHQDVAMEAIRTCPPSVRQHTSRPGNGQLLHQQGPQGLERTAEDQPDGYTIC